MRKPPDLQNTLVSLWNRCQEVDIASFEERDRQSLVQELAPVALTLLEDGEAVVIQTLLVYDAEALTLTPPEPHEGFMHEVDELAGSAATARTVADLAFLARGELVGSHENLLQALRVSELDRWELVGRCGSSVQRLAKACTAIENALAEHEDLSTRLDFRSELRTSLEVRRTYARLRHDLLDQPEPDEASVRPRLADARHALERLVHLRIYRHLRISDRVEIRRGLDRLAAWQTGTGNPEDGVRLWQDLVGMLELIQAANNREELLEHDREQVEKIWQTLFSADTPPATPPPQILARLQSLFGRSETLDRLLAEGRAGTAERWRQPLRRVADALDVPLSSPSGS